MDERKERERGRKTFHKFRTERTMSYWLFDWMDRRDRWSRQGSSSRREQGLISDTLLIRIAVVPSTLG